MSEETPLECLSRLGTNGVLWAQEFNKTAVRLGYSEMDEEWLAGWFANAIENCDVIRCNPLRAENEQLRKDLKTAIMGDSAELQDVKRENEKLQKQSADSYNAAIDAAALIAKTWGPPNWSWSESSIIIKDTCDEIALAIRGLKKCKRQGELKNV